MPKLFALSVRQPWAELFGIGGKTVEVRKWRARPPVMYEGSLIAIHAGKTWDASAPRDVVSDGMRAAAHERTGGIVAVARFERSFTFTLRTWAALADAHRNPPAWWEPGLIGIEFVEAQRLPELVACPGQLGFFELEARIARKVREQLRAA